MATNASETDSAFRTLRPLVDALGFAHLLYVLTALADEQHDAAVSCHDLRSAIRAAHDARILGEAAKQLS